MSTFTHLVVGGGMAHKTVINMGKDPDEDKGRRVPAGLICDEISRGNAPRVRRSDKDE